MVASRKFLNTVFYKLLGRVSQSLQLWCTWTDQIWRSKSHRSRSQPVQVCSKIHFGDYFCHCIALNGDSLNWFGFWMHYWWFCNFGQKRSQRSKVKVRADQIQSKRRKHTHGRLPVEFCVVLFGGLNQLTTGFWDFVFGVRVHFQNEWVSRFLTAHQYIIGHTQIKSRTRCEWYLARDKKMW